MFVFGLSVRLLWYPMWMRCDCDACTVVCVACVYAERVFGCNGDGNAGVDEVWLW